MGKREEAIADYTQAIQLNPGDATAYNNRGSSYAAMGKREEAIADYTQAIQLNPEDAAAYNNLGDVYLQLRRLQDAESAFRMRIHLSPSDALAANVLLGAIAQYHGETESAHGAFARALDVCEIAEQRGIYSRSGLLESKAIALIGLGKRKQALDTLARAIEEGYQAIRSISTFMTYWPNQATRRPDSMRWSRFSSQPPSIPGDAKAVFEKKTSVLQSHHDFATRCSTHPLGEWYQPLP
jgi:tetratricopeptide (TPR) repeat protein